MSTSFIQTRYACVLLEAGYRRGLSFMKRRWCLNRYGALIVMVQILLDRIVVIVSYSYLALSA